MELYFTEQQTDFLRFGVRITETLYHERSPYQDIMVVHTENLGRLLALDGFVQLTVRDEFVYHEMLAHVPMFLHTDPRHVLVIGGGDGGTVREVLRHPGVERVVLAEIDGQVIDVCRRFFPETSAALEDPRVEICVGDGIEYVKQAAPDSLDIILVDSSEPVGPGIRLFESPFYGSAARALGKDGILAAQTESPFYNTDLIAQARRGIAPHYAQVRTYLASVPTYPSGLWSFTMGLKDGAAAKAVSREEERGRQARMAALEGNLRYWTPEIQSASFCLPRFLKQALKAGDDGRLAEAGPAMQHGAGDGKGHRSDG